MRIKTKEIAKLELLQIKLYIAQDSIYYANKTVIEINKRIQNLLLFPEMGKVIEKTKNVRQIIYKSYKIYIHLIQKILLIWPIH